MSDVADLQDVASVRSGRSGSTATGTTGGMSETSSQQSDNKFLRKKADARHHDGEDSELAQKRNLQEGMFACMYTLVKQSALSSWKFALLKIALEFMMNFIVVFNPSNPAFKIDTNDGLWQILRWIVWRSPIMRLYGYKTYVTVMYVMVIMVALAIVGLVWLTMAMRKQEQSKWLKHAATFLHIWYDLMFVMCYVSFFDYFSFMADCDFAGNPKHHLYFEDVLCLEMPHLLHMLVALFTAALFLFVTALMMIAGCDLNPVSKGYLASPAAYVRLKILFAKAAYIVLANCLNSNVKVQTIGMVLAVGLVVWWNLRGVPFYRKTINVVWTGLWFGVLYTCVLALLAAWEKDGYSPEKVEQRTQNVLYGVFPTVVGGALATWLHLWWYMRPAKKFVGLDMTVKLTKVHKFADVHEVEVLSRVVRKFDIDGVVDEEAAAHGEIIVKAGLQVFPGKPHLLILYSNFVLEVKKDGPASRTQLQLAAKASPNLVERYQIFCTNEASKRLKDSQEGGMDLQAYIEFKRNFRAILRVHKDVLMMQADLWQQCMKSTLKVTAFDNSMESLESAIVRANQVYKRVLERYPNNGKLLRCYGKFLEGVKHDPVAAARVYGEANRQGGANALLALDLSGVQSAGKPEFLTSMSMEDDAVIVIDAEGTIMMVSQAVQKVFGYTKLELEGVNVSILMPQPFSQRHPSYLQRYITTSEAHMLDTVKEVVALHKDRYVFPLQICVTKLSGVGSDSVFLGVVRPMPPNVHNLRAWIAPNGVFLCADQQFASAVGAMEGELVGRTLTSMVADQAAAEILLERCRDVSASDLDSGLVTASMEFKHRYLESVVMDVTVRLAGTDGQRILVLNCQRTDAQDSSMLVVDVHMKIKFASADMALLLGYSMRKLATMRLDQILPPPYNTLHAKWLKDPPTVVAPYSCRAGVVVHFQTESGGLAPARLIIKTLEVNPSDPNRQVTQYIVQVSKITAEEVYHGRQLVLTTDFNGRVLQVSDPLSTSFDFQALRLIGLGLGDFIDVFGGWVERGGDMQMLLLALLYKEQELPGMSWRMRVIEPQKEGEEKLPIVTGAQSLAGMKGRVSRSACVQVELDDEGGGAEDEDTAGTRIKVTLWRRDLMAGMVELDEDLVIRKASFLTGLITGVPSSFMHKKPLSKFLDIPEGATWDKLVKTAAPQKKSALKAAAQKGIISPVLMYVGPHPDSGTMRLRMQGVHMLVPGGRAKIIATLHPDTTYTGAHVDLMKVLKIDTGASSVRGGDQGEGGGSASRAISAAPSRAKGRASRHQHSGAGHAEAHGDHEPNEHGGTTTEGENDIDADNEPDVDSNHADDDDGDSQKDEGGANGQQSLHRVTTNKSEFIEQWVRTLSKQVTGEEAALDGKPEGKSGDAEAGHPPKKGVPSSLAPIPEGEDTGSGSKLATVAALKRAFSNVSNNDKAAAEEAEADKAANDEAADKNADKLSDAGESSVDGSQAASAFTATTDTSAASELVIDSRRSRLHKVLNKLLMGASFTAHVDRLRIHSYFIIVMMFTAHLVGYLVITSLISNEHDNIYLVHEQAMAMDRSQLIAVRGIFGTFCQRANVTAKVSACANSLEYIMEKLYTNVALMEKYHQDVYLGLQATKVKRPELEVYDIWTNVPLEYSIFLDTNPPKVVQGSDAVWVLGNRYIAAAREALYLIPSLKDLYKHHRTFAFMLVNGLGPLFQGYAESLDFLVDSAWKSIEALRVELIILLIVEAIVVQLIASIYEGILVQRLESVRMLGILAMLGLPGPVLRQLSTAETKIVDDSDDDDDDDDDNEDEEGQEAKNAPKKSTSIKLTAAEAKGAAADPVETHGATPGDGHPLPIEGAKQDSKDVDSEASSAEGKEGGATAAGGAVNKLAAGRSLKAMKFSGSKKARASDQHIHHHGHNRWRINGKTLIPSYWNLSKFAVPFVLWNITVVVVYVISLLKLNGMQAPLASLNMASHVTYRYTRVRAMGAAFVTQDSKEDRDVWRPMLQHELDLFESEYDALMYGGLPISLLNSTFRREVPAGTFESTAFAQAFFKAKQCMRYEQHTCFPEGHLYYEVTHNGLDAMVRRMISEMRLLSLDADEDVSYDSPRYTFMATVGGNDLYEGLQQAAQLFVDYSIARYDVVTNMHTILLICAVLLVIIYLFFLLWPHLKKTLRDAGRQSALLSLVPPEMDVKSHVRAVARRGLGIKRTHVAPASSALQPVLPAAPGV
ncbi:hypothetical protein HYH03_014723 [Edaphochlamys debaryana]|uniref:PAS domain-containing protein n=1 Tax=Edaphochlamys debaryana TaxID=47281 RepID=A0A835XPN2_9CHLO|nr:hypothetical protein HYH03_014723 [Edaphochlamys debaryana]|eukprot:KAG2486668.1 hypothetical protein HYH03_014723 [Edaphochlamys debaryana]